MSSGAETGGPLDRLSAVEERVRQFLIERARKADSDHPFQATVTYGDLCHAIDPGQRYWVAPRFGESARCFFT